jgi:hypothetical protein
VDGAFCLAILRGSVWAGETEKCSPSSEEGGGGCIDKFGAIVGLEAFNREVKLSLCKSSELN